MKTIKTYSIGDIHGRNDWMYFTHGSPVDFETWRTHVENTGDPDGYADFDQPDWHNYTMYDKIIFVGDYVDSFTISNIEMKKNLEDIIFFKKTCPDKVVLLLGNHDVQYIVSDQICSGYRSEMRMDFYDIFHKNIDLFKLAHQIGNVLWTHAGVTAGWWTEFQKEMYNPNNRFIEIARDNITANYAGLLNLGWEMKLDSIYNVDHISGGFQMWAGPLWVRPHVLNKHALEDVKQIVGHTPQAAIWECDKVVYIDCLEHGGDSGDCYALDIEV
jgi:predicted MPP superfamily phosphohydrolase